MIGFRLGKFSYSDRSNNLTGISRGHVRSERGRFFYPFFICCCNFALCLKAIHILRQLYSPEVKAAGWAMIKAL